MYIVSLFFFLEIMNSIWILIFISSNTSLIAPFKISRWKWFCYQFLVLYVYYYYCLIKILFALFLLLLLRSDTVQSQFSWLSPYVFGRKVYSLFLRCKFETMRPTLFIILLDFLTSLIWSIRPWLAWERCWCLLFLLYFIVNWAVWLIYYFAFESKTNKIHNRIPLNDTFISAKNFSRF